MKKNDLNQARRLIKECQESQSAYLDLGNCGITDLNDLSKLRFIAEFKKESL